jgi:7-carboxy-7-deazaguanine synthase
MFSPLGFLLQRMMMTQGSSVTSTHPSLGSASRPVSLCNRPSIAPPLPVVETFHSVQGEGTWAGTNAFFIRLAGCNVGCSWCDTKDSWNAKHHELVPIEQLADWASECRPRIVVVTGGEPLMHDLDPLVGLLKARSLQVHLETSGAYPLSGQFDWITLSPKRHRPPHIGLYSLVNELKVVIVDEEDLRWAEEQSRLVDASVPRFLQPEWGTVEARGLVFDYVLRQPAWRVSLQSHKFLGIR